MIEHGLPTLPLVSLRSLIVNRVCEPLGLVVIANFVVEVPFFLKSRSRLRSHKNFLCELLRKC